MHMFVLEMKLQHNFSLQTTAVMYEQTGGMNIPVQHETMTQDSMELHPGFL